MKNDKKPEIITVYSRVSLDRMLTDTRYFNIYNKFGIVKKVAKQYGIKVKTSNGYNEFSAPKSRMQLFVEKLHFSGVTYSEQKPY